MTAPTPSEVVYIAMRIEPADRLPEILRGLVTRGTCDRCGAMIACHAGT